MVTRWVRLGAFALLALPNLVIGTWAMAAPDRWFDTFPGFDPRLVAADPPFNEHLATDAGAGFFATGLALAVAAIWGRRSGLLIGLVAYAGFTVPHVLFHAFNPAPGLTGSEDVVNVVVLASSLVFAAVIAWGALRPADG